MEITALLRNSVPGGAELYLPPHSSRPAGVKNHRGRHPVNLHRHPDAAAVTLKQPKIVKFHIVKLCVRGVTAAAEVWERREPLGLLRSTNLGRSVNHSACCPSLQQNSRCSANEVKGRSS